MPNCIFFLNSCKNLPLGSLGSSMRDAMHLQEAKGMRTALVEDVVAIATAVDERRVRGDRRRIGATRSRGRTATKRGRSSVCPETRSLKDVCCYVLWICSTRGVSVSLSFPAPAPSGKLRACVCACVCVCVVCACAHMCANASAYVHGRVWCGLLACDYPGSRRQRSDGQLQEQQHTQVSPLGCTCTDSFATTARGMKPFKRRVLKRIKYCRVYTCSSIRETLRNVGDSWSRLRQLHLCKLYYFSLKWLLFMRL